MAYFSPLVGPAGLVVPAYADIIADLIASNQSIYGQTVYLTPDAADYQWISALSAKLNDAFLATVLAFGSRSPVSAIGAALDSLGKLMGISRKVASASTVIVVLTGDPGTPIYNGAVEDANSFLWSLPAVTTIGAGGTVSVQAICETTGVIVAGIGQVNQRATPTAGWVSVTNPAAAVTGLPVETDSAYRARMAISATLPSNTLLAGTIAGIAKTLGVTRYNVLENATGATDSFGNPAHSVTAVVEGGADADVAQAIYANRGIGAYTNGTTVITVTDPSTGASMPIRFLRPSYVPIYVSLSVHPLTGFTSDTQAAIPTAIVAYLNSLQIGELIVQSELVGAALTVRPNADLPMFSIRSLFLGTTASPTTTTDVALTFAQVASGVLADVILTLV